MLVVDDHPMFREGLRFTLSQAADVTVVGEASNGAEALDLCARLDPDVVVMDINMPVLDGLSGTSRLAGQRSQILMLTMYDDDANVFESIRAGARGYVVKGAGPEQILSAVRAVADGHAVFGPALASRMLTFFSQPRAAPTFPELSTREQEILSHLADGLSNREIADRLYISPITVRNHVSSIFTKLQVTNRRQAMLRAQGLSRGLPRP